MKRAGIHRGALVAAGARTLSALPTCAAVLAIVSVPAGALERPASAGDTLATAVAGRADTAEAEGRERAAEEPHLDIEGYGSVRFETSDAPGVATAFTLRRLVLETTARPAPRLQFHTEIEWERLGELGLERGVRRSDGGLSFEQAVEGTAGSEIAIEQAWGEYRLMPTLAVRFGAILPPVGRLNPDHDDFESDFPRRPLIDRAAAVLPAPAAWTELGLGLVGSVRLGSRSSLAWAAYALNGTTLSFDLEQKIESGSTGPAVSVVEVLVAPRAGAFDGSSRADAIAGRLLYRPAPSTEVGLSGYTGRYTPPFLDRSAAVHTVGVDGLQWLGPVRLTGEFLLTRYDHLGRTLRDLARRAGRTEASGTSTNQEVVTEVELTAGGLSNERYGFWIDAAAPFRVGQAGAGKGSATLAPIVRYERVWLSGDVVGLSLTAGGAPVVSARDRQQSRLSAGLAFRPAPEVVIHLVYEHSRAHQGPMIAPEVEARSTNALVLGLAFGF